MSLSRIQRKIVTKQQDDAHFESLLRQAPPGTRGVEGTAYNDLGLAICCYFMTGSAVGETVALEHGDDLVVLLAVAPSDPVDVADFEKFTARLAGVEGVTLSAATHMPPGLGFNYWELRLRKTRAASLARELVSSPGAAGWGSAYPQISSTFGAELRRIAGRD
jgi:hypothetical protein